MAGETNVPSEVRKRLENLRLTTRDTSSQTIDNGTQVISDHADFDPARTLL
jgi:hypothetical protein